mgnify:CR=1 FL=1|jgi:uncharacterized protein (DUF169 family)
MDERSIRRILREDLHISKEVIALRQCKQEPEGFQAYQDKNNICYMMGEVLEEGRTFYTVLDDHVCLLGCAATGLDPALTVMNDGQRRESEDYHVSAINIFPTEAVQQKAERAAQALFPRFREACAAILMGPLGSVPQPDALIILANAEQVHRLTRAYCYATGSVIKGFAGMGACRMLLPRAFIHKQPVFTVSDRAWRRALKLLPDELTLVTPPAPLVSMIENLEASQ